MSHYSDDYEYEAKKLKKSRNERIKKHLEKVSELQVESRSFAPVRFMDMLEDYENWLKVELGRK